MELALGKAPKVDGKSEERMRVGCGSAVSGFFAPYMAKAADEVIVLDGHITGLFSEHPAGKYIGKARSGITITGQKSTDGRYFPNKGTGWGGTDILRSPRYHKSRGQRPDRRGIDRADHRDHRQEIQLPPHEEGGVRGGALEPGGRGVSRRAQGFLRALHGNGGAGRGRGRFGPGGRDQEPHPSHEGSPCRTVAITMGGARPFIFPGGGINFLVDVGKIKFGSIYLSPTPSFVIPVEYTMRLDTFRDIGGHLDAVQPLDEALKP